MRPSPAHCTLKFMRQNTERVSCSRRYLFGGALLCPLAPVLAQDEPRLVPESAEVKKLLPLLPEPPEGWKADPAEGSADSMGDTQITTVHRDYVKGEGDAAATTSISILDSIANPGYVEATTSAWNTDTSDAEGYAKSIYHRWIARLRDVREQR